MSKFYVDVEEVIQILDTADVAESEKSRIIDALESIEQSFTQITSGANVININHIDNFTA